MQYKCLVVNVGVNISLPAYGQQCSICNKYNHFALVCCSRNQIPPSRPKSTSQIKSRKKLHAVVESQKPTDTEDSDSEPLLVTDALNGISESMWLSTITILGNKITFKLDSHQLGHVFLNVKESLLLLLLDFLLSLKKFSPY